REYACPLKIYLSKLTKSASTPRTRLMRTRNHRLTCTRLRAVTGANCKFNSAQNASTRVAHEARIWVGKASGGLTSTLWAAERTSSDAKVMVDHWMAPTWFGKLPSARMT